MKIKTNPIFKLLICVGLHSFALAHTNESCPPAPLPVEQAMAYIANTPAKNAGFLWRVEKEGHASWLYGTMHLMHIDYAKPGMQIMMGMRTSDILAVEINTYEHQTPHHITDSSLALTLSNDQLERLRSAYKKDCLTDDPKQLLVTPLMNTQANRKSLYWGYGPDARLMQIAKRTNKPIVSLESLAIHADALRARSQAEFDEQLNTSLNDVESGRLQDYLIETAYAWQRNDLPFFFKQEQDMTTKQPSFMSRLNDERNQLMAQKIDALHGEGKRVFVAVGALHMTGHNGIPKLLQDKGYKVHFVPLQN